MIYKISKYHGYVIDGASSKTNFLNILAIFKLIVRLAKLWCNISVGQFSGRRQKCN